MTWFTTHLALEGLVGWVLLGRGLRDRFTSTTQTKLLFLGAHMAAIAPDLDYLLGFVGIRQHRGPTHSLLIPLLIVLLAFLAWTYVRHSGKEEGTSPIWSLLPQALVLAAFFYGFHLILDFDSGEGGMMLFWPLDDRLYTVKAFVIFDAFPLLLLPWTPLGFDLRVDQSTIQGLYSYLLNWSPQDFQQNFGTTKFAYPTTGAVLHGTILLAWLHFVLRVVLPPLPQNRVNGWFQPLKKVGRRLQAYWQQVPKLALGAGVIVLLGGFALGPMVGPTVRDSQDLTNTIELTDERFRPFFWLTFETVAQPLDPRASQTLDYKYNVTERSANRSIELMFVVAPMTWWNGLGQSLSNLRPTEDEPLPNNTIFHTQFIDTRGEYFGSNPPPVAKLISSLTGVGVGTFETTNKDSFGAGVVLHNWVPGTNWTDSAVRAKILVETETTYERKINFTLGVATQLVGGGVVIGALVMAAKKGKIGEAEGGGTSSSTIIQEGRP